MPMEPCWVQQEELCTSLPMQGAPPCCGAGLVHCRLRRREPDWHGVQDDQQLQRPSTSVPWCSLRSQAGPLYPDGHWHEHSSPTRTGSPLFWHGPQRQALNSSRYSSKACFRCCRLVSMLPASLLGRISWIGCSSKSIIDGLYFNDLPQRRYVLLSQLLMGRAL